MAKELNFQDGNDILKYQDSNSTLKLYLSEDGLPFDLSRLDNMTLKVGNDNGYLLEKVVDLSNVSDPTSGNVTIPLDGDIMTKLIPDDYNIEIWTQVNPIVYEPAANYVNITVADTGLEDTQAIFPNDGTLVITVSENIKADPYDTINAYPLDDVWNSINEWKTSTLTSVTDQLTTQLGTEIRTWQGDIATSLKSELLNDLSNDEGVMRQQLHDVLETALDNLITQEINSLEDNVKQVTHDAMISDVANQIATIKPQITNDLHTSLSGELSNELTTALQNWESSTDTDLNNKLAQAIVDKTTKMQGDLSTELTNYLQGKLSDYETTASQNITNTITQQVTKSISDQFANEDSQVRTDLENLVKGTIQDDINKTLQQMQENGDIYATKQEFTDFTNTINADLEKLDLANDIGQQIGSINNKINILTPLINGYTQQNSNEFGSDFNSYTTVGIYTVNGMQNNLPNSLTQGVIQVGYYDGSQDVAQLFWDNQGNVYNRGVSQGSWNSWTKIVNQNDFNNLQNEINTKANETDLQSLASNVNTNVANSMASLQSIVSTKASQGDLQNLSSAVNSTLNTQISSLQNSVGTNSSAIASNASSASSAISSNANSLSSSINSNASQISQLSNTSLQLVRNLTGSDDLNNIFNTGVYPIDNQQPANLPDASQYGVLNVYNVNHGNVSLTPNPSGVWTTVQTFTSTAFGSEWYRYYNWWGKWSKWYKNATGDDINNVQTAINQVQNNVNNLQNSVSINMGETTADLNTVTQTGRYWSYGNNPNVPSTVGGAWFELTVETGNAITFQHLIDWTQTEYVRSLAGSPASWSVWKKTSKGSAIGNWNSALDSISNEGLWDVSNNTQGAPSGFSGNGVIRCDNTPNHTMVTLYDDKGPIWTHLYNTSTSSTSGWIAQASVIVTQTAQQAQSINAPANTIVISEN